MRYPICLRLAAPAAGLLLLVGGCASQSNSGPQAAAAIGIQCPAGHTLTCEARSTGRIHHGSFRKDNDHCACVREGFDLPASPVIPGIRP